jgi:hypothetical protein
LFVNGGCYNWRPFYFQAPKGACLVLAQSGHPYLQRFALHMSAFDPKADMPFKRNDALSAYCPWRCGALRTVDAREVKI